MRRAWAVRWWIAALVIFLVVWIAAGRAPSGSATPSPGAQPAPSTAASSSAPSRSVAPSQPGLNLGGAVSVSPEFSDVTLGPSAVDVNGVLHTRVTVANHSSKTSNYLIGLRMMSATGQPIGHTDTTVKEVAPGEIIGDDVVWSGQSPETLTGVSVQITDVDRWAS